MAEDVALARLSTATRMLAEARDLSEVRAIRDMAEAARAYAAAAGLGDEAIGYASAIKLDAEQKAGAILAEIDRAKPKDGYLYHGDTSPKPTLSDLGVTRVQSSRWQALARMDPEDYAALRERVQSRARAAEVVPIGQATANQEDAAFGRFLSDEEKRAAAFAAFVADLRSLSMRVSEVARGANPEELAEAAQVVRIIANALTGRPRRPERVQ